MKPTAKKEPTIEGIDLQANTLIDLPVANHQAELAKAGEGSGTTVKTDKDVTDIVSGSGLGAMPHVK